MIQLILSGRIPSKKNSKIMVCRGKRPILLPSEQYAAWQVVSSWELKRQKPEKGVTQCEIVATFFLPDARRTDLSNKWESVGDLLVDNGILVDDNCTVITKLTLVYGGIDKVKPRVNIEIFN